MSLLKEFLKEEDGIRHYENYINYREYLYQ